jgi:hypothetical protein
VADETGRYLAGRVRSADVGVAVVDAGDPAVQRRF